MHLRFLGAVGVESKAEEDSSCSSLGRIARIVRGRGIKKGEGRHQRTRLWSMLRAPRACLDSWDCSEASGLELSDVDFVLDFMVISYLSLVSHHCRNSRYCTSCALLCLLTFFLNP